MVVYLGKPARKWLMRKRREIKVGSYNSLWRHENYNRDYFGRLASAAIFRWFLAAVGNCFWIIGRLTHARDH